MLKKYVIYALCIMRSASSFCMDEVHTSFVSTSFGISGCKLWNNKKEMDLVGTDCNANFMCIKHSCAISIFCGKNVLRQNILSYPEFFKVIATNPAPKIIADGGTFTEQFKERFRGMKIVNLYLDFSPSIIKRIGNGRTSIGYSLHIFCDHFNIENYRNITLYEVPFITIRLRNMKHSTLFVGAGVGISHRHSNATAMFMSLKMGAGIIGRGSISAIIVENDKVTTGFACLDIYNGFYAENRVGAFYRMSSSVMIGLELRGSFSKNKLEYNCNTNPDANFKHFLQDSIAEGFINITFGLGFTYVMK